MNTVRPGRALRWLAVALAGLLFLFAVSATLAAGNRWGPGPRVGNTPTTTSQATPSPLPNQATPLTDREIAGLVRALDDEYRAYAIYGQVIADFGQVQPFVNIQRAEAQHSAALIRLFNTYSLPVPENSWLGNVPRSTTLTEACAAGVTAEIANRDLYTELFTTTARADILTVYRSLQRASEQQHLPAFQRCAAR